jgi:hypothetical protein
MPWRVTRFVSKLRAIGRKLVKKIVLNVCLLTLCNPTLFAQTGSGLRAMHTAEKSAVRVPPPETPETLQKIYTNMGSSKTDLYNDTYAWTVSGPNSDVGLPFSIALPFTPKSDSHVSQVQVAVQYFSGTNQVNLSIYGDASGTPGTLLAGPVTVKNLADAGTCCALAVANFTSLAVAAGTRYWVVADSPLTGTGSDFDGSWDWVAKPIILVAGNHGDGWSGFNGDALPAGEVLGTIP